MDLHMILVDPPISVRFYLIPDVIPHRTSISRYVATETVIVMSFRIELGISHHSRSSRYRRSCRHRRRCRRRHVAARCS